MQDARWSWGEIREDGWLRSEKAEESDSDGAQVYPSWGKLIAHCACLRPVSAAPTWIRQ